MEMAEAEKQKIQIDGKTNAALSQQEVFARQKQQKDAERVNLHEQLEALRNQLHNARPEFEKQKNLAERATYSLSEIRHFEGSFGALLVYQETTLKKTKEITEALAAWDATAAGDNPAFSASSFAVRRAQSLASCNCRPRGSACSALLCNTLSLYSV